MNADLIERIDAAARLRGQSRGELIQEALEEWDRQESARVGRLIAEGYRRIPQDTPDEWGDPMAQNDAETSEVLKRLDAEEREAGLRPLAAVTRGEVWWYGVPEEDRITTMGLQRMHEICTTLRYAIDC